MIAAKADSFRSRLSAGALFGTFSKTEDPAMVEAMGYAGMDFIVLDLEHGPNSIRSLQNLLRAAELSGTTPIVRVRAGEPGLIGEVLDVGAAGVQVPHIRSAEDVRTALRHARFSPLGERGVCRFVRAARYSAVERSEYFEDSNRALVVLQVEGKEGIERLPEIAGEPGVDVLFLGPYDLSQSVGVPGQVEHPTVTAAMEQAVRLCRERGVTVGTFVDTLGQARLWMAKGVRYIAYGVDAGILQDACRGLLAELRG